MRIEALSLEAFGPFSGRELELGGEEGRAPGAPLCVVYGPNEAGKSSALRAIRGLVYGIEHDSRDNFVHAHADLRIGARLRFRDGLVAHVLRRKGRKQTLTGEAGAEDEGVLRLEALAQAVPESLFRHFYGLDHPALVEGSQQLLEDGGELSRSLFGAGLGIVHLRKVIDGLESEAAALFVPRGQKQRIAVALAEWKALQAEIRSQALEPSRFEEQAGRVEQVEQKLAALEAELAEIQTALSRARREKDARLALAQAEQERQQVQLRIERERERARALALAPELLEARETIEVLHQRLEGFREARDQLPRREQKRAELAEQIALLEEQLGAQLGAASAADLRRVSARVDRIRTRAGEVQRAADRLEKAREAEGDARLELARLAAGVGAGAGAGADAGAEAGAGGREAGHDVGTADEARASEEALESVLARVRRLGPIDEEIAEIRREVDALDAQAGVRRQRLGLGALANEVIETLGVPGRALIEAHARRGDELAAEAQRLQAERAARLLRQADARAERIRLEAGGALPSLEALQAARVERDTLWRRLREAIARPSFEPGTTARPSPGRGVDHAPAEDPATLAQRLELAIEAADRLADRLRADAERVARGAELTAQLERWEAEIAASQAALERCEAERAGLDAEWRGLWPAVLGEPGAPATRLEWRSELAALIELFERRRAWVDKLARRRDVRRAAIAALADALTGSRAERAGTDAEAALAPWLVRAEQARLRRAEIRQQRREALSLREQAERQLERLERDRRQAEGRLERAQAEWAEEREAARLPAGIRLEEVAPCLDRVHALIERRDEAEGLERRIEQMRALVHRFETDASRLVATCLPGVGALAPDVAALRLKRQLEQAQEQATLAEAIRAALADAEQDLHEVEARLAARTEALKALAAQSAEAAGIALDRLVAQIAQLETRIQDRHEERLQLAKSLSVERANLDAMDGNARIAELAERAEGRLAAVRADVARYAELRLARRILEQEIEAFRRENQGPLLAGASRLFAALTEGAYPQVLADAGEAGRARLVAVSASGRELGVEALSAGTRDQLFLALRLAALSTAQGRVEPMPLVADDILIEFDDRRTRAALAVLAEVGRETQVLLFSHHRHVVELARGLGPQSVHIVEL